MSMLLRRAMMMASSVVKHIISSVSGLVTFTTNVAASMPSVLCEFAPVQSGSGDPAPDNVRPISGWTGLTVTRAGKNLLALPIVPYKSVNPYGGNTNFNPVDYFWIKAGTYTLSYIANESNRYLIKLFDASGNALSDAAHSPGANTYYNSSYKGWYRASNKASGAAEVSITIIEDCYIRICRNSTYPGTDTVEFTDCQLESGGTATAYVPYAGETAVAVNWQSDAGTVYGGTLDVATGVLTVTMANIASYAGESINEPWISSKDKYVSGNTPTTGAQVVYTLATPQTYQLTPAQVQSIIGTNNVWHNANGGITVEYYDNQ